ncbi:MAG: hypothetical protein Q9162_001102 [Coniocarpon cinnabarinum]
MEEQEMHGGRDPDWEENAESTPPAISDLIGRVRRDFDISEKRMAGCGVVSLEHIQQVRDQRDRFLVWTAETELYKNERENNAQSTLTKFSFVYEQVATMLKNLEEMLRELADSLQRSTIVAGPFNTLETLEETSKQGKFRYLALSNAWLMSSINNIDDAVSIVEGSVSGLMDIAPLIMDITLGTYGPGLASHPASTATEAVSEHQNISGDLTSERESVSRPVRRSPSVRPSTFASATRFRNPGLQIQTRDFATEGASHRQSQRIPSPPSSEGCESVHEEIDNWTDEEEDQLFNLQTRGMTWDQIADNIRGRSAASCRARYHNTPNFRVAWDEDQKNKFAMLYNRSVATLAKLQLKGEVWERLAKELHMPWRSVEDMHWQMGAAELTQRASFADALTPLKFDSPGLRAELDPVGTSLTPGLLFERDLLGSEQHASPHAPGHFKGLSPPRHKMKPIGRYSS